MTVHNKNKIASLLDKTFVVGSLALKTNLARLEQLAVPEAADFLELRLDAYPALRPEEVPDLKLPLLITARCPAEGGQNALGAAERAALLRRFLPRAQIVDVEIQSLLALADVCAAVRASPAILLASFHDFTGTPSLEQLQARLAEAVGAGAEAVKFATTLHGPQDVATLVQLLALRPRPPLSVMGMGPLGKLSRLLLAPLGSCLNYGYLDAPTVPGQWESRRLKALLAEIAAP